MRGLTGSRQLSFNTLHHIYHMLTCVSIFLWFVGNPLRPIYVIPIYKKVSKSNPLNYRAISLTSISSKTFEHIVSHDIYGFLECESLLWLFTHQHSFCKDRSCNPQLLNTVTDFIDYSDEDICLILNFLKAFNVVSHPKLPEKLFFISIQAKK